VAAVVRSSNQGAPIDVVATGGSATLVSDETIPAVTPNFNGSLLLAGLGNDSTNTITASPGWTVQTQNTAAQASNALLSYNSVALAGVTVGPSTATVGGTLKYAAIVIAVAAATGSIVGSGTQTITATASGNGFVNEPDNGSLTVTATATGTGAVGTAGGGSLSVTNTETGSGTVGKVGSGPLSVTAAATGTGTMAANDSASLVVTASATGAGVVGTFGGGSLSITATATGAGTNAAPDGGSQTVTATGTGAGILGLVGAGPTTITATGTGVGTMAANDSASLVVTATATGAGVVGTVGGGSLSVTDTATGGGTVGAVGTGSQTVTATATGTGSLPSTNYNGSGSLSVTATATGTGVVGLVGSGSLSVDSSSATGTGVVPAVVLGTPIRTAFASTSNPTTGTVASAGVLQAGDVIAVFLRSGSGSAAANTISGWSAPVSVAASSVSEFFTYHVVTSAEVTAGTRSWTLTGFFTAGQTGASVVAVVRGATSAVIDTSATAFNSTAGTTHILPGITPTLGGSLVLAGIGNSGSSTYSTAPSGWTIQVQNAGAQSGGALLSMNSVTTLGTSIGNTSITNGSSTQYASITVAFASA